MQRAAWTSDLPRMEKANLADRPDGLPLDARMRRLKRGAGQGYGESHKSIQTEALMEQWSVRDDRPYVREGREAHSAYVWWVFFLVILGGAAAGTYYFWPKTDIFGGAPQAEPAPASAPAAVAPAAPAPQPAEAPPVADAAPAAPLPSLDNSDAMMRETVTGLVGRKAFEAMVYPSQLVRRIV